MNDPALPVKLVGGYRCCLTRAEMNRWTEYVARSPEWMDFAITEALRSGLLVRQGATPENLEAEIERTESHYQQARCTMFTLAKRWHEQLQAAKEGPVGDTCDDPGHWAYGQGPQQPAQGEPEPAPDASPAPAAGDGQGDAEGT